MKNFSISFFLFIIFKIAVSQCTAYFYNGLPYRLLPSGYEMPFSNLSSLDRLGSFWDFGDGTYSNDNSDSFFKTYENPGYYTVKLTIQCPDNGWDTYEAVIEVGDLSNSCLASFQYQYPCIYLKGQACFLNYSLGGSPNGLNSWLWEFGNGDTSTMETPPPVTYTPGYYNVKLTLLNQENQCTDTYQQTIFIDYNDCQANFCFFQDSLEGLVNFFDNSYGTIVNYNWDFGDGTASTEANPVKYYANPGYYNVCLSVGDGASCYNTTCKTVPFRVDTLINNASFDFFVNNDNSVYFVDNSLGTPNEWEWNFGDGNAGTGQIITHNYAQPGLYLVQLRVANTNSQSYYVKYINVGMGNVGVQGAFNYYLNHAENMPTMTVPVDFKGSSLGEPSRGVWHYGDGDADSTTYFPSHIYDSPGVYHACLTVYNTISNQMEEYCRDINVVPTGMKVFSTNNLLLEANPNPFTNSTKIAYSIPKSTDVSLIVYDLFGNKQAVLVEKYQEKGKYTLEMDRENLSTGIYLLEFRTSCGSVMKKLAIID